MPTDFSIFGPSVSLIDVENAYLTLAKTWLPTYLSAVDSLSGRTPGTMMIPRSYQTSFDFTNMVEGQIPAVVVMSTMATDLTETGDGDIGATYTLHLGALAEDQTEQSTRLVTSLYAQALAMMVTQQAPADSADWFAKSRVTGYTVELADNPDNRTLGLAEVTADVIVMPVFNEFAGPQAPITPSDPLPVPTPNPDPTTPWPNPANPEITDSTLVVAPEA